MTSNAVAFCLLDEYYRLLIFCGCIAFAMDFIAGHSVCLLKQCGLCVFAEFF